jgi:DNA processing protein
LDPRAQGANHLIKEGALLVESAEDVIEALEPMTRTPLAEPDRQDYEAPLAILPSESELEGGRLSVLDLLSADPVAVDELIRQCQLSPAVVTTALLELELAGRIERYPGNRVARRFLEDEE